MCEYYNLFRLIIRHTLATPHPNISCGVYAITNDVISPQLACPGYIVYALIHQHTFLQRWNDVQATITPSPPLQTHRYIDSPIPVTSTTSSTPIWCKPISSSLLPSHALQPDINLSLLQYTVSEIDNVHDSIQVHLTYPNMPVKFNHLRSLHKIMHPANTCHQSNRVLYDHLFISALSPLIPRDRSLSLAMDNIIYILIINSLDAPPIMQHCLHLFFNPSKESPYLQ